MEIITVPSAEYGMTSCCRHSALVSTALGHTIFSTRDSDDYSTFILGAMMITANDDDDDGDGDDITITIIIIIKQ